MKYFYILLFFFSFSKQSLSANNLLPLKIADYYSANKNTKKNTEACTPPNCFHLEELIKLSITEGLDSKEKAEKVYQSRLNIHRKVAALIPSINLGSILGLVHGNILGVVSSFSGSLLPSKWFQWKESSKYANAEIFSYKTLLANQINTIEVIYYNIHSYLITRDILNYYHWLLDKMINYIEFQRTLLSRNITEDQSGFLYNLRARIASKLVTTQGLLDDIMPDLASIFNFKGDWALLRIAPIELQAMDELVELNTDFHLNLALERSSELMMLSYLSEAAELAKKSRYFDFMEPGSDGLGFSYITEIKFAKSEKNIVAIHNEKMQLGIKQALIQAINNYNSALQYYQNGQEQSSSLSASALDLEAHISSYDTLSIEKISRYIENAIEADVQINTSQHLLKNGQSGLNRLLWQGDTYNDIIELDLPHNAPTVLSRKWFEDKA